MRQLHETYTAPDFLAQAVREIKLRHRVTKALPAPTPAKLSQAAREMLVAIPWGHHVNLLAKIQQPAQRLYYLQAMARFGWSHNFPKVLPEQLAEQPEEALKSSYNLEFLGVRQQVKERELEDRLTDKLRDFVLELGFQLKAA